MLVVILITVLLSFIWWEIVTFFKRKNRNSGFIADFASVVIVMTLYFTWESSGSSYPSSQDNIISGMREGVHYELISQFTKGSKHYAVVTSIEKDSDVRNPPIRTFKITKLLPEGTKVFRYRGVGRELDVLYYLTPTPR